MGGRETMPSEINLGELRILSHHPFVADHRFSERHFLASGIGNF